MQVLRQSNVKCLIKILCKLLCIVNIFPAKYYEVFNRRLEAYISGQPESKSTLYCQKFVCYFQREKSDYMQNYIESYFKYILFCHISMIKT